MTRKNPKADPSKNERPICDNIGFVMFSEELESNNPATIAVNNFLDIYEEIANQVILFGPIGDFQSDSVEICHVTRRQSDYLLIKILYFIYYQLLLTTHIHSRRNELDVVYFHIGGTLLILPQIYCRFIEVPSATFMAGIASKNYFSSVNTLKKNTLVFGLFILERLVLVISQNIVFLSKDQNPLGLTTENQKVKVANINYIPDEYFQSKSFGQRNFDIGFVGRFEEVKGVLRFANAISMIIKSHSNIEIILIGDGPKYDQVKESLKPYLSSNVSLTGWVEHDKVYTYLMDMKLIVLPSESEGVPKVLLEAMSCGTIPVVTQVGALDTIVNDGQTGFVLRNNSQMAIRESLRAILDCNDLNSISKNAQNVAKEEFSYSSVKESHQDLLVELMNND